VFRNQGRGTEEKGKRREFVNDLLRSDFHKKFMVSSVESRLCLLCGLACRGGHC